MSEPNVSPLVDKHHLLFLYWHLQLSTNDTNSSMFLAYLLTEAYTEQTEGDTERRYFIILLLSNTNS